MSESTINIPLDRLANLAVEHWRLADALKPVIQSSGAAPIRHALRKIEDFLKSFELEARVLDGQPYDAGLAVRVIDTIEDDSIDAGKVVITQTLSPMILYRDSVLRPGDVVIARRRG